MVTNNWDKLCLSSSCKQIKNDLSFNQISLTIPECKPYNFKKNYKLYSQILMRNGMPKLSIIKITHLKILVWERNKNKNIVMTGSIKFIGESGMGRSKESLCYLKTLWYVNSQVLFERRPKDIPLGWTLSNEANWCLTIMKNKEDNKKLKSKLRMQVTIEAKMTNMVLSLQHIVLIRGLLIYKTSMLLSLWRLLKIT